MNLVTESKSKVLNGQISYQELDGSIVGMLPALNQISLLKSSTKVAFAVAKNIKKLTAAHETKSKTREAMLIASALKDEEGKPVIKDLKYQFPDKETELECIKKVTELETLDSGVVLHHLTEADIETIQGITAHHIVHLGDLILEGAHAPEPAVE